MEPPASPHADEHTALRRSSVSSEPATVIQTEPPDKDDNYHANPSESELRIIGDKPRGRLLGSFLPTVFVLLVTLGFAFLILGWLLARQYEPIQGGRGLGAAVRNGSFIVYEGGAPAAGQKVTVNLRVLTFSSLVSHLISDTSSVLMTLVAYRAGSQWLQNSRAEDLMAIMQNPTPLQYGLLVRLLGSSSIMSIYETGRYAVRPKQRSRLPRLFKEAFALAIIIWIMSHAVGLADLYLHTTTRSILVDLPTSNKGPGSYPYAVAFNETLCTTWPSTFSPCLSNLDGWALEHPEVVEPGYLAIANRSNSQFQVITLADALDTAIAVPGAGVNLASTAFTARTFGARAECRPLNRDCEGSEGEQRQTLNCTQAGYPGLPYYEPLSVNTSSSPAVDNYIFGVVNGEQGGARYGVQDLTDQGRTTNPVNLAIQMRWRTHINNGVGHFTIGQADSAVDIVPIPYITLYAGCSVTFSNVTVQYAPFNNSWKIMAEEQSSDNFTTVMWAPTVWQLGTEQLASEMMTIAMTEMAPNVTAALNQYLARTMLGVAVGMFQSAEATDVKQTVPTLLGQYPVAPVMILITLLFLYALLAIVVFTSSWLTKDETIVVSGQKKKGGTPEEQSVLNLTQRWLVDPLPLVAAAFPGEDGKDVQRTVADSARDMVYDGIGADARLSIGLQGNDGFGLRKRGDGRPKYKSPVLAVTRMDPPATPHADEHADIRRSPTATVSDNPPEPQETDDSSHESELHMADANARHRLLGFLPTVFVLFISMGFAFLILGWLLTRQYEPIQGGKGLAAAVRNGSFIVYEGGAPAAGQKATVNLRVLTFSALVSHLISDTSSILMTLVAYRAGSQWLQNSREGDLLAVMRNPTPLQYGLLVRLLGSSSIISIYETGRYAVHPQKRSRLPRLFKEAFAFAVTVWIMSHAVGLADLYLHTTTRSILVDLPVINAGPGSYPYAVGFNETLCVTWTSMAPCLSNFDGWALEHPEVVEPAYLAIANRTDSRFNIITLADSSDAAIVIPGAGADLSSTAFTARTFSARAACRSLNHDCERDSYGQTTNCTQVGYPGLPYYQPSSVNTGTSPTVDNYIFGVVDGQQGGARFGLQDLPHSGRTTNPVNLAIQMRWSTHIDGSVQDFATGQADSAVDIIPIPYITLYAGCSVTFSNATVQYLPYDKSWTILLEEQSSDNFTTVMWAPTVWQLGTEQLASEMMTIAMTERIPNVTAALNQRLARTMLGVAVGILQSIEATDVKQTVPSLLGQYPVAPVMILIILLFLYALLAIFVFVSSWLTKDETIIVPGQKKKDGTPEEQSVLNLTQRWLVDPLPLVAAAFPGEDGKDVQRTVADSALDMVYDGNGPDARLSIGLRGRDGFGLRKRGDWEDLDE